jgi:hypothetical protein
MILGSHCRLRRIARLALVLLFFAQAALATMSGCFMSDARMAKAIASADTPACAGGMNLNLCLAHCNAERQSLDTGEPPVLAPASSVVLVVPVAEPPARRPIFPAARLQRSGDPPIPIRFCSLRT